MLKKTYTTPELLSLLYHRMGRAVLESRRNEARFLLLFGQVNELLAGQGRAGVSMAELDARLGYDEQGIHARFVDEFMDLDINDPNS